MPVTLEGPRKPSRKDNAKAREVAMRALQRGAMSATFCGERDRYEFAITRNPDLKAGIYITFGPHGFHCQLGCKE